MGAGVALQLAAGGMAPLKSLVLIDPVGLGEEINADFLSGYIAAKRQKKLRPVLEQLVSDKSLISIDMMEDVFKFKRMDGVIEGLNKLIDSNFPGGKQGVSLRLVLAELKIPVTVIWGRDDEIIPASHAEDLPASVNVEIIENSGHVPQMEHSSRVNEIIKATLEA